MSSFQAILTFDDGPRDERGAGTGLDEILQTLEKEQITGVFFLIGEEVKQKPLLAKSIVQRGHIVQNHSWQHLRLDKMSEKDLREDLLKTQEIIQKATGVVPDRLRPPYGAGWVGRKSKTLEKVAAELHLTLTGWDVDTNDWVNPKGLNPKRFDPPRDRWKRLYATQKRPLDILMHVQQATARDLPGFIDWLKGNGCSLTTFENHPTPHELQELNVAEKLPL